MAEVKLFGLTLNTDKLTDPIKMAIGGGLGAVIILTAGYYKLYPAYVEYQDLSKTIEDNKAKISSLDLKVKKLPELKKELTEIEGRLVEIRRKIPTKPNVASLLVDLEQISESGVHGNSASLDKFIPSAPVGFVLPAALQEAAGSDAAKQIKQIPVEISLSKITYPDLIELLTDYESYERTISVENLMIKPLTGTPGTATDSAYTMVDATFTIKAFLLDGSPQ